MNVARLCRCHIYSCHNLFQPHMSMSRHVCLKTSSGKRGRSHHCRIFNREPLSYRQFIISHKCLCLCVMLVCFWPDLVDRFEILMGCFIIVLFHFIRISSRESFRAIPLRFKFCRGQLPRVARNESVTFPPQLILRPPFATCVCRDRPGCTSKDCRKSHVLSNTVVCGPQMERVRVWCICERITTLP